MRTTFDIDTDLLEKVVKVTHASTKKAAVKIALQEFLRIQRRKQLIELIGNYDRFALRAEDLERMRSES